MERLWLPKLVADEFIKEWMENWTCSCKSNLFGAKEWTKGFIIPSKSVSHASYWLAHTNNSEYIRKTKHNHSDNLDNLRMCLDLHTDNILSNTFSRQIARRINNEAFT